MNNKNNQEFLEKERLRKKIYRENNKELINQRRREKYKNNLLYKEYEVQRARKYREDNIEKAQIRENNYKKNNRDKVKAYSNKKYNKDANTKLAQIIRVRIRKCIKNKSESSMDILGASIEEVVNYIEKQFTEGMTWENHGINGWHIDHIKPIASFDLTDLEQQRECFNYKNMQPLWAKDNISKGKKLDWELPSIE
jgi:hypothetical protein